MSFSARRGEEQIMYHEIRTTTVRATFENCFEAEIACALLSDASLQPEEPEAEGLRTWVVRVPGLSPTLARRAEAILRSACACDTRIVRNERRIEPSASDQSDLVTEAPTAHSAVAPPAPRAWLNVPPTHRRAPPRPC